MTYHLIEKSTYGAKPIECFLFQGSISTWRYTSADENIILDGETYTAIPLKRLGDIEATSEVHKSFLKIGLPKNNSLALQVLLNTSDEIVTITIYRFHHDDEESFLFYWKGRLVGANMESPSADVVLNCESIFTSLKRTGVRLRQTKICNVTVYSARCGLAVASYATAGTVAVISSNKVELTIDAASGESDSYFLGGFANFSGVLRHITYHVGSKVIISRPVYGLVVTASVNIYPGCDHLLQTCIDKFDNLENFRGFPWIPTRNPFDGRSIM